MGLPSREEMMENLMASDLNVGVGDTRFARLILPSVDPHNPMSHLTTLGMRTNGEATTVSVTGAEHILDANNISHRDVAKALGTGSTWLADITAELNAADPMHNLHVHLPQDIQGTQIAYLMTKRLEQLLKDRGYEVFIQKYTIRGNDPTIITQAITRDQFNGFNPPKQEEGQDRRLAVIGEFADEEAKNLMRRGPYRRRNTSEIQLQRMPIHQDVNPIFQGLRALLKTQVMGAINDPKGASLQHNDPRLRTADHLKHKLRDPVFDDGYADPDSHYAEVASKITDQLLAHVLPDVGQEVTRHRLLVAEGSSGTHKTTMLAQIFASIQIPLDRLGIQTFWVNGANGLYRHLSQKGSVRSQIKGRGINPKTTVIFADDINHVDPHGLTDAELDSPICLDTVWNGPTNTEIHLCPRWENADNAQRRITQRDFIQKARESKYGNHWSFDTLITKSGSTPSYIDPTVQLGRWARMPYAFDRLIIVTSTVKPIEMPEKERHLRTRLFQGVFDDLKDYVNTTPTWAISTYKMG